MSSEGIERSLQLPVAISAHLDDDAFALFLWDATARCCQQADSPTLDSGAYFKLLVLGFYEGLKTDAAIAARVADSKSARDLLLGPYQSESSSLAASLHTTRRAIGRNTHHAIIAWLNRHSAAHPSPSGGKTDSSTVGPIAHLDWDQYLDALDAGDSNNVQPIRSRHFEPLLQELTQHIFKHVSNLINCSAILAAGIWLHKYTSASPLVEPASFGLLLIGFALMLLSAIDTNNRTRYLQAKPILKSIILLLFVALYVAITVTLTIYKK